MSGVSSSDVCHSVVIGVDQVAVQAEQRWGVGRLPQLVSDATRLRFREACALWRDAIQTWHPGRVEYVGGMMRRAWAALEAEAASLGHRPLSPEVWEVPLPDGRIALLVRTPEEAGWLAANRQDVQAGRDVEIWTLEEVGRLLAKQRDLASAVVLAFPGARVTPARHTQSGWAAEWCAAEGDGEVA